MGHRKHNAPRRGSLAFAPRARHQVLVPRIRSWAQRSIDNPTLGAFPTFKAGMVQVITVDDRERTPNFGKPMFNPATVLSAPPVTVLRVRAYRVDNGRHYVAGEVFADDLEDHFKDRIAFDKKGKSSSSFEALESNLKNIVEFSALIGTLPNETGLANGVPQVQEVQIAGGDSKAKLEYLKGILGKQVKASDLLKAGSYVDAIAITKGKGFEGPVTRFGVKRKQHKSRKSVRAVGVISPWHPATVMYTVARAGQMGFHQRIMKSNRILAIGNAQQSPISPSGGFLHFGEVKGEYLILRGSVPGSTKRLVSLRVPLYARRQKAPLPRIVEVNVSGKQVPVSPIVSSQPQPTR
jgi:large subunit ribosomal protein L3